jgi:TatD DNase family protein
VIKYIDTHFHLDERIKAEIEKIHPNMGIIIGTDTKTNKEAINFCERNSNFFFAIGIHPSEVENYKEEDLGFIKSNVYKAVAVGEIGLDYFWVKDNKEKQKTLFKSQIKIAIENDKPVIIHNREATDDIYDILSKFDKKLKIVFHCFTYGEKELEKLSNLNCKFGFGGPITYPKNDYLREVVRNIPLSKILLETDSPYLPPQEKRGELNNPSNILLIANKIAEIKGIEVKEVIRVTTLNAIEWFDLSV